MKQFPGKYADIIDEWLHDVAVRDDEESFGDVESPTGYVWKVTLDPEAQEHEAAYLERKICEWYSPFFLVVEDSQGLMLYPYYDTAEGRDVVFQGLSENYYAWADEGGEG